MLEDAKNQSIEHAAKTNNRPAMVKIVDRIKRMPMDLGPNEAVEKPQPTRNDCGHQGRRKSVDD
jgi:hypothetical protein